MITYTEAEHVALLPSHGSLAGWAGRVETLDVLRQRLGVPLQRLNQRYDPWPRIGEVQHKRVNKARPSQVAAVLRSLLVTWWQLQTPESDRRHYALTEGDELESFYHRLLELDEFLKEHGVNISNQVAVQTFMSGVVGPWASQAEIALIHWQDYDRQNRDLNITDHIGTADLTDLSADRNDRLRRLAAELDQLWLADVQEPVRLMVVCSGRRCRSCRLVSTRSRCGMRAIPITSTCRWCWGSTGG